MKINTNLASAVPTVSLMGATAASQADFVLADAVDPARSRLELDSANYFKDHFKAPGITHYTLSTSLEIDEDGTVTYYYVGKEAGYRNDFIAGPLTHSTDLDPRIQDYFDDLQKIGDVSYKKGEIDFKFCSYNLDLVPVGCMDNIGNDLVGMNDAQSIAMSIGNDFNTAWLFWDDGGSGADGGGPTTTTMT